MKRFRLDDLPLMVKVGFAPALALLMLALMAAGAVVIQQNQMRELEQVVRTDMPNSLRMQKISEQITAVHGDLYILLTHQAAQMETDKIGAKGQQLLTTVDKISKEVGVARAAAEPAQRPQYDKLLKDLKETREALDIIVAMMSADFASAAGFAAPFEDQYAKMSANLQAIVAATQAQTDKQAAAASERSKTAQAVTIAASVATLLITGVIAVFLVLNMRRAVQRIAGATERLSRGENDVDLDNLERKDELGAIVKSLNVFRDNQLHLERMRLEQEEQRAAAEATRRESAAAAEASAEEQARVVDSLAGGLERLAAGDLTVRLQEGFPGSYEKLRNDFNDAVVKLEKAMSAIAASTSAIRSGGSEISGAADDLSQRTERQAATLEQTAAALDQITATVQRSAEGATLSREAVAAAKTEAERSGDVVSRAVTSMTAIEASAREINQIIGVVDEIAFQTNLLALNAGVEAARAGDAGKGFAVVASEVRALAQRSAESAKQIKSLISTSTAQVSEGVSLVGETGQALHRIVAHVDEVSKLVSEIAASAKEEATGIAEVNTAVNQMDQVTQQNAAMVEETTAASRMLADQTEELFGLVSRFQLSQSSEAARANTPPPRSARPTFATAGNTALAEAADDWTEF
ncbi:MAG: chemotaxis protein [Phenylobacterium sp. RIFCSPHIGHO2_01_FULL_69_31]|uniref:methyl-accepting chemotaxis protein n=1 Tax=Phenylobacterium sp. RIFCSPHIGHO2_01_FULL_69_31 TaxID=1801944 RepID=UPI0008AA9C61|nr:HAMP domain-containing methyl-accepting chemotaxis protein [Phenylobacterium sp. RIFCSPHIGHO2_01_FULL_69_31]OHB30572.1 MAG: chemotaxis protein [Phenylobacterium sp. RIFCSPHIGHO2_01_FULL_69_31]